MGTVNIRLPNITDGDPSAQMAQLRSYLYQMAEQLNWAFDTIEAASNGDTQNVVVTGGDGGEETLTEQEAESTFSAIKSLIIKSADIVDAYSEEWDKKFNGKYFAESNFGTYLSETSQVISANSSNLNLQFEKIQEIDGELNTLVHDKAYIKAGELYTDNEKTIYGIEVGAKEQVDDEITYNKYARFTSNGIYFYLPGYADAVYRLADNTLYVNRAEITGSLKIGRYIVDPSDGLAFKWTTEVK